MAVIPSVARLLSQYIYYLAVLIICVATFMARSVHDSGVIPVEPNPAPWDSNDPIKFVAQFSDIHINPILPKAVNRFKTSLASVANKIQPNLVISSGDLADNYDTTSPPGPTYPHEQHWQMYAEIRDTNYNVNVDSPDTTVNPSRYIEFLGNHDAYGYTIFNNESIAYKHFLHKFDLNQFFSWTYEKDGIRLITMQPYIFPTGHGPQLFVPPLTPEILDALESQLSAPTTAKYTFVGVHFPHDLLWPDSHTSKTRKSYVQLIKDANVTAILCGHTHPRTLEALHLQKYNTIEYVSSATRDAEGFNLISFDNGRVYARQVYPLTEDPFIVVTCPTPDRWSPTIMTYNDFEIHIVVFGDNPMTFEITGDVTATLTADANRKPVAGYTGRYLYSYPVHLENGSHEIAIRSVGDSRNYSETIKFSIGQTNQGLGEVHKLDVIDWSMVLIFVISNVWLIFILVASFIPHSLYEKRTLLVDTDRWITESEDSAENAVGNCGSGGNWAMAIGGGPIMIGYRMAKLPLWCRIVCAVVTLWGWVFPISFYKQPSGLTSILFFYGYITDGKSRFDLFSFLFHGVYLLTTAFWFYSLFCAYTGKANFSLIFDFVVAIVLVIGSSLFWGHYGADVSVNGYWASSFTYFIFPVLGAMLFIPLFIMRVAFKKEPLGMYAKCEDRSESSLSDQDVKKDLDDHHA